MEGVSAAGSGDGGIWTKVFIAGVILLITVVGAKNWFYPYTLDDLKEQIELVHKTIKENTALGRDLLGDLELEFRERLAMEDQERREIEERSIVKLNRWNLVAWIVLRWQVMRDVEKCYSSLVELRREVMVSMNVD
ncbi:hypothetical protein PM082_022381 [Marasmius tenuissimus]|nr:hypothetical protein PM082_022381 [Marasmius tenuissimus]